MKRVLLAVVVLALAALAVDAAHIKIRRAHDKADCVVMADQGCQGGSRYTKPKMVDSLACEKTNTCCNVAAGGCNGTAPSNKTAPAPGQVAPPANKQEQVLQPSPAQPQASTSATPTPQAVQVKKEDPAAPTAAPSGSQPAPPAPAPLAASAPQNATSGPNRENKVITHIAVSMNNRNIIHAKQNQAAAEDHQDGKDMAAATANNAHPTAPEKTPAF